MKKEGPTLAEGRSTEAEGLWGRHREAEEEDSDTPHTFYRNGRAAIRGFSVFFFVQCQLKFRIWKILLLGTAKALYLLRLSLGLLRLPALARKVFIRRYVAPPYPPVKAKAIHSI